MSFDIAITSVKIKDHSLTIHEVHNVPSVLEARLTLGVSAFNILKKIYGDLFVGYGNAKNDTQDDVKNIKDLKEGEVALVVCDDETSLNMYLGEVVTVPYWTTTISELRSVWIGYFKYEQVSSVVLPELRTKIAELESHWDTIKKDKQVYEDLLYTKEFMVDDLNRQITILTITARNLEVSNKNLITQVDNLTNALSESENNIRLRGEDCKRLVVENARLRDADDKNYMSIMRLNNEITNLRNAQSVSNYQSFVKKSLNTFDAACDVNYAAQGFPSENTFVNNAFKREPITKNVSNTCVLSDADAVNIDVKPIKRVTQDTQDESSYDQCIKIIKNFDKSMLKSKNNERTLDTSRLCESSKKSQSRSELNKRK